MDKYILIGTPDNQIDFNVYATGANEVQMDISMTLRCGQYDLYLGLDDAKKLKDFFANLPLDQF